MGDSLPPQAQRNQKSLGGRDASQHNDRACQPNPTRPENGGRWSEQCGVYFDWHLRADGGGMCWRSDWPRLGGDLFLAEAKLSRASSEPGEIRGRHQQESDKNNLPKSPLGRSGATQPLRQKAQARQAGNLKTQCGEQMPPKRESGDIHNFFFLSAMSASNRVSSSRLICRVVRRCATMSARLPSKSRSRK